MFTHFYSDPHLGHRNIIRFSDRPFHDVNHMAEGLIERYNAIVKPTDNVLWVGDVAMKLGVERVAVLVARFNGRKSLVMGNHDGNYARAARMGFDMVTDECFMHIGGRTVRVKHYPYPLPQMVIDMHIKNGEHVDDRYPDRRPPRVKGEVLIHGHTHSDRQRDGNQIHVGVDAWDYKPVTMAQVEKLVAMV